MISSRIPSRTVPTEHSRRPIEVIEEAEQQWIYTEEELLRSPSICDGLPPEEERTYRYKGYNFISQVGVMLKLPQTTISSATVFFNRFLMRYSLKASKSGEKKLHHYQIAATALFLATKVEEHCRKVRELVIACCRVAQKNPNLIVDENTKDYWRWRDTIILNEDVLLELLCFDLTVESPYNILFGLLQYYGVEKQKKLRDAAWSFINDSNLTQACLLFTSRTIACAALWFAARQTDSAFGDGEDGKPWWEVQKVPLRQIKRAMNYMADFYTNAPGGMQLKTGSESVYTPLTPVRMERSGSELSTKREREDEETTMANGIGSTTTNGSSSRIPAGAVTGLSPAKKIKLDDRNPAPPTGSETDNGAEAAKTEQKEDAGSEEGEVEE
ncbi:hypothetical protein, variant [Verruconis gallopava]|uniref:RNA polymerase II holoenzyme cyclin-like subunit n=1 Tax=Verruconis gallopava TaxID=253628 RepID=A0A0D1XZZ6_9PEZI|nr:hypothetical protein, variant [Verruconis gallopava]KIW08386.1 hypothetical protein, variant [Verruconis gallopava]